jgi:cell division FtsZ-interacting protein ZapD
MSKAIDIIHTLTELLGPALADRERLRATLDNLSANFQRATLEKEEAKQAAEKVRDSAARVVAAEREAHEREKTELSKELDRARVTVQAYRDNEQLLRTERDEARAELAASTT